MVLRKISLVAAVAACLLIPASAFARGGGHGGHGGGWHGHGPRTLRLGGYGGHTIGWGCWDGHGPHKGPLECLRIHLQQNYPCWNTNHPVDCQ
jgi:hypothetical protein